MTARLDSAISKAAHSNLRKKLNSVVTKNAELDETLLAKKLLGATRRWVAGMTLRVIFFSLFLGIIPILYAINIAGQNKGKEKASRQSTNLFTRPYRQAKETITSLKSLTKGERLLTPDEDDLEDHDFEEEAVIKESDHPLGMTYGGMSLASNATDLDWQYEGRSAATVLRNGSIIACDTIKYDEHDHRDYAIGRFKNDEREEGLFRFMNPSIQNMAALEYEPNKFAYFYHSSEKFFLTFNNGERTIETPGQKLYQHKLIPIRFEITEQKMNAVFLDISPNGTVECVSHLEEATGKATLETDTMGKLFQKTQTSYQASHRTTREATPLYDDKSIVCTAATYMRDTKTVYIAGSNMLKVVPVDQLDSGLLCPAKDNSGHRNFKLAESEEKITHLAVSDDEKTIGVARENGMIDFYQSENNTLKKITEIATDPQGVDGNVLDMKFVNGCLVIACQKQTLVTDKAQYEELLEDRQKSKVDDKASLKALRNSRSRSQDSSRYDVETSRMRLTSYILSSDDIFVCDDVKFSNNTTQLVASIIPAQYGISTDKSIITNMGPKRVFTVNSAVDLSTYMPIRYNNQQAFLVREENSLVLLDSNGQKLKSVKAPYKFSKDKPIRLLPRSNFEDAPILIEVRKAGGAFRIFNKELELIVSHDGFAYQNMQAIAYNPNTKSLYMRLSSSGHMRTRCYDLEGNHKEITIAHIKDDDLVEHIIFSENGQYMATSKWNGPINIYRLQDPNDTNLENIELVCSHKMKSNGKVLDLRFVDGDRDLLIATDSIDEPAERLNNFVELIAKKAIEL